MADAKTTSSLNKQTDDIVASLEKLFKGLPHLPENVREVLVKIGPWLALVFGILGILVGVGAMGVSPLALFGGVRTGMMVFVRGLLTLVLSVLMLLAYPGLSKRAYKGWIYLFWAEALSVVYAVLTVSAGPVLGALIGLYLLFEVKRYYK